MPLEVSLGNIPVEVLIELLVLIIHVDVAQEQLLFYILEETLRASGSDLRRDEGLLGVAAGELRFKGSFQGRRGSVGRKQLLRGEFICVLDQRHNGLKRSLSMRVEIKHAHEALNITLRNRARLQLLLKRTLQILINLLNLNHIILLFKPLHPRPPPEILIELLLAPIPPI